MIAKPVGGIKDDLVGAKSDLTMPVIWVKLYQDFKTRIFVFDYHNKGQHVSSFIGLLQRQ